MNDETRALQEAYRQTPDNLPLRSLYFDALRRYGYLEELEQEYRSLLSKSPDDSSLKIGLAQAFYEQDKHSQAIVIIEQMVANPTCPPEAEILHAKLLVAQGDVDRGVRVYKRVVDSDPEVRDEEFEEKLGITDDDYESEELDVIDGKLRESSAGASSTDPRFADTGAELERPKINFSDVGGMESVKEEVRLKIIHPMTHPEIYQAYGKKIGGGILLYGPPGCGKTYLARATAGEVKANYINIGIHDVLDMWIGQSEKNLHAIFDGARRNSPCVLFFDEVDALGASRRDMKHSASRQTINQFLSELDGAQHDNEGVLIIAATNAPWHIDPAFRRPGRFDRMIFVPPPDREARSSILRILLRAVPAS